jgi:Fe-S oxidoreductase
MYDVMDLCIECKACKAECPSSVDMAKIKTEFLAQYHAANGVPFRARLFANIGRLSRLSSGPLAPLANWSLKNGLIRKGLERVAGIAPQRTLPAFARQSFAQWFRSRKRPNASASASPNPNPRKVVLFNDTYNNYNTPHIAIAATEVLEEAGFQVILSDHGCCGRPMISKGLIKEAKQAAAQTVDRLAQYFEAGMQVVALEPSCLSALKDDYLYLLADNEKAKIVAESTLSFEEFMAQLYDDGELDLTFTDQPAQLLLHGHCHQKALIGTEPSRKTLSLPPNYQVREVDSGCCGMAGSFGYEAEHYDISLKMAERRLLPAVREATPETLVVAAGVSCRQQIQHGTNRQPLHPAEVLRNALL